MVLTEPNGNAIVRWLDNSGALYALRYETGTGWAPFDLLERSDVNPGPAERFVFGMDHSGNIIAAWREWDGKRWWIHVSRFDTATGWGDPEIIDTGDKGDSSDPDIIMIPAGNAIMRWQENTNQGVNYYARMYVPGAGWGAVAQLPEGIGTWYKPAVCANGNAIFPYKTDVTNEIYARHYDAVGGWGVDERIDMGTGTASGAAIGMDSSGNATIVWTEDDGAQRNTYARRFEVGVGWGPAQVNAEDSGYSGIEMDASANAVIVRRVDGDYGVEPDKIYANTYKVDTGWGASELIWTASNLSGSNMITTFETNSHGEAILLWNRYENSTINIYANYYSPESGWDTAVMIGTELDTDDTVASGPSWTGRAAIDEMGNALAIWRWHDYDVDDPIDRIHAREYKRGEGWKTTRVVVSYYPWYRFGRYDIARQPVISKNPVGDAFVVWMTPGMEVDMENMYRVYAARYVAERPPACNGDFAPDGDVDAVDLSIFAEGFGRTDCGVGAACEGDFDADSDADGKDLFKLIQDFGRVDCPRIY
jgi:hypothetical protein